MGTEDINVWPLFNINRTNEVQEEVKVHETV